MSYNPYTLSYLETCYSFREAVSMLPVFIFHIRGHCFSLPSKRCCLMCQLTDNNWAYVYSIERSVGQLFLHAYRIASIALSLSHPISSLHPFFSASLSNNGFLVIGRLQHKWRTLVLEHLTTCWKYNLLLTASISLYEASLQRTVFPFFCCGLSQIYSNENGGIWAKEALEGIQTYNLHSRRHPLLSNLPRRAEAARK